MGKGGERCGHDGVGGGPLNSQSRWSSRRERDSPHHSEGSQNLDYYIR